MFNKRRGAAMGEIALPALDFILEAIHLFPIESDSVRNGVCEMAKRLRSAVVDGDFVPDAVQLTILHVWVWLCIRELDDNSYVPDNIRQQLRTRLLRLHSIKRRGLERLKGDEQYYSELCLKVAEALCDCEGKLYLQKVYNERVN